MRADFKPHRFALWLRKLDRCARQRVEIDLRFDPGGLPGEAYEACHERSCTPNVQADFCREWFLIWR